MEPKNQDGSMSINFLPEDILLEILARLPVKSLLRFRSVAKSWRDIMKERTFVTKHHLNQVALNNGNCVFTRCGMPSLEEFVFLTKDAQGVNCTRLEGPFFNYPSTTHLEVAGPCNGIVVISNGHGDLYLWNPATREYKAFPRTSISSSFSDWDWDWDSDSDSKDLDYWSSYIGIACRVGFGIDSVTKDYKIVRIWNHYEDITEVFSLSANSCSPKGESWKIINYVPPISLPPESDQVYLNGKYYWCTDSPDGSELRPYMIVWFDMGAEVFGLIELPDICPAPYWDKLVVFKESLALVRRAYGVENKYKYQIWIMDGSVGLSWKVYATVGPLSEFELPLGLWKNEELIFLNISANSQREYMSESFSYDIKTHLVKTIMQGVCPDDCGQLAVYNESLVSFMGDN